MNAWRLFCWRTKSPASNAPSGEGWMESWASGSEVMFRMLAPAGGGCSSSLRRVMMRSFLPM